MVDIETSNLWICGILRDASRVLFSWSPDGQHRRLEIDNKYMLRTHDRHIKDWRTNQSDLRQFETWLIPAINKYNQPDPQFIGPYRLVEAWPRQSGILKL
jgi:hypothetical protein